MLPAEIEVPLSQIERQCQDLMAAVVSGDPLALEAGSQALRQAATDFSSLLQSSARQMASAEEAGRQELRVRLQGVATQLGIQRENLLRRTVVVERAVHLMVPATRQTTYSKMGQGARATGYRAFAA